MRRRSVGSGRYGVRVTGVGRFGVWLETNMKDHGLTCQQLADMLFVTRQTVSYHVNHHQPPSFPTVVAYCWMFGLKDNPHDIWALVEDDWGC